MTQRLTIHLAQLNPTVGAIAANAELARAARAQAAGHKADILVFPELFITGYPPEDLVLKPAFQADAMATVRALAAETADGGPAMIIGVPWIADERLYNGVAVLDGGEITALRFKYALPNYGVFDEKRVFHPGPLPHPVDLRGARIGIPICEDVWVREPVAALKEAAADFLLVPNGSPFQSRKYDLRLDHIRARIGESGLALAYVNQVGGQDELVFDGGSFVINGDGQVAIQASEWHEAIVPTVWTRSETGWACEAGPQVPAVGAEESLYQAAMIGLRDYVAKNRFPGVVLGLSGGIDSALSATVAVDALGPERVWCVMLPSRYTSGDSLEDAKACAEALGVRYETVEIEAAVDAFTGTLAPVFGNRGPDITEENLQSRIRGVILMALSNKFGPMVLTTGNKSEVSVGYATLYGDMCGGYNALKDLYKTQVFALSRWRNGQVPRGAKGPAGLVIPERIISKPPTAELRADQRDEDSLPPYADLDDILECLIEREMAFDDVVARGHAPETVKRIEHLVYVAEYKRRQAAPGVKVSLRNFGRDRRYPITNGFRNARN
ncbi:MAG: NAD+ synthase [Alphaproteobacteria bacterium]